MACVNLRGRSLGSPSLQAVPNLSRRAQFPGANPKRPSVLLTPRAAASKDDRGRVGIDSNRPEAPRTAPSLRPPPPPPPPPPEQSMADPEMSKRSLLYGLLGGAALGTVRWLYTRVADNPGFMGNLPQDNYDISYVTTKGGNQVAVYRDALNRVWMVDKAGDVFMDTGDPDVGVFAVDVSGNITNYWEDNGETKSRQVGNIRDMQIGSTRELGDAVFFVERGGIGIPSSEYARQNGYPEGVEAYPPFIEERLLSPEEKKNVRVQKVRMRDLPADVARRLQDRFR